MEILGFSLRWYSIVTVDQILIALTHLLCVRKLPLTCPEPSQPGVGQDMPSVFPDFHVYWEPFMYPSFCRLAARGQPDALR